MATKWRAECSMAPANPENDCTGKQRVISVESGEAVQVKSQVRFATYLKTWEWNTVFLSYNFILNQTPSVEMALFVLVYCCFLLYSYNSLAWFLQASTVLWHLLVMSELRYCFCPSIPILCCQTFDPTVYIKQTRTRLLSSGILLWHGLFHCLISNSPTWCVFSLQ